jgi:hypothetical protein
MLDRRRQGCTIRRYRDSPKAPKIDVLARHYLWRGLSKLPDVTKHVADTGAVEKMGMWELLKLAESMGVDADSVIRATEQEERQLLDYSHKYPGFRGELEFDWTVAFLGQSVTRKARVVYQHTPQLGVLRSAQERALHRLGQFELSGRDAGRARRGLGC